SSANDLREGVAIFTSVNERAINRPRATIPGSFRNSSPVWLQCGLVEVFFIAEVCNRIVGTSRGSEIILFFDGRGAAGELFPKIDHRNSFHLVWRSAIYSTQDLVIADLAALAWLRNIGLIYFRDAPLGELWDAIFIGGL